MTQPDRPPLVIGLVDRRKGPSREIEQANTHNELAEYRPAPGRVKTRPEPPYEHGRATPSPGRPGYRFRATRRSSQTGSGVSRTRPSCPKTR